MRFSWKDILSAVVLVCIFACQERQPTSPTQIPGITADWTPGPLGQPYTVATPPWSNQVTPNQSTGIDIPAGAPARITASGTLSFTVNGDYVQCNQGQNPPALPGGLTSVGAVGFPSGGKWQLETRLTATGSLLTYSPADPSANTVTALTQGPGTVYVGRSSVFPYACGQSSGPSYAAYAVSGSQTVSVEALDSAHAVPDKPSVAPGDTVTFTVQVSWSSNFAVFGSWSWISDTTTQNSTFVGNCFRQTTCKVLVREKGHVYIDWISVEGGSINLTARSPVVTIYAPQFKVSASPRSVAGAQSVTFTATVTPSVEFALSGWTWTPDSGTGGIAPNGCTVSEKTCTRTISKSGCMKATTTIGPYALADSAHVSVVPCLTNDSILDDSRIRRKLAQAWNNSNPNGPAAQRREQFGMRVRLPSGQIVDTNFTNLPGSTPCQAYDPTQFNPRSVGDVLLTWHTHPFEPAHYVAGVGWVISTPAELLPYPTCGTGPSSGLAPGPSLFASGSGDLNQPWPQVIVDKTNAYWIAQPATDPNLVANVRWRTVQRSQCDILTYY